MGHFWNKHNLFYRTGASVLIILHLVTFGPMKDALAFSAQSASYKLSAGSMAQGGGSRDTASIDLKQSAVGEPCIGRAQSANYALNTGFISTLLSSPPVLTAKIPYQIWPLDSSKADAFDLDNYFSSPDGLALTYTVSGNSNIIVTIDPTTHVVSFSQPAGWSGVEKIIFLATDSEGNSTQSNKVALLIENPNGPDKPVIVDTSITPSPASAGDLIKLTVAVVDLNGATPVFNYSDFFSENRKWQEAGLWYSEATWQTGARSTGHYNIRVTVNDGTGLSDTESVLINIGNNNRPPVLNSISDITVNEGQLAVIAPQATDPDGDPIVFYFSAPFDSQGKWLTDYDSSGTHYITVTASDGIDTVTQTARVTVNNTNRAPLATLTLSHYTVEPNQQFNIILTGSDPDSDALSFILKKDGTQIDAGVLSDTYSTATSFADNGYYTISATVTDSGGMSTTVTKNIQVTTRSSNQAVMGDFNGDSLTDLGVYNWSTGEWEVCLSQRGVFESSQLWLSGFGGNIQESSPVGGDFNGDGKTDAGVYNYLTGELKIASSTGSSFSSQGVWLTAPDASYSWQPFTGNFNADKYTDFGLYNRDTGEVRVFLGTSTGFNSYVTWLTGFGTDCVAMSGDFNGDSLSDLCLFKKSSGEFKVAFSNTKAFVDGSVWLSGYATNADAILSDFNNDGLTDVGYWSKDSGRWYYASSNGVSFIPYGTWLENFGTSAYDSATTGDFDGNGVTDAAVFDADGLGINRWSTRLSTNKPADLLTGIDNGIGGKTQINYTYAATMDNPEVPFPVYVASDISLINNTPVDRAAAYTQNFIFSGGYYDATEREFRGFAKVKVTDPITGNYSETYFYQGRPEQDGALKGQIEKILAFDGNGRHISQALNTYEVRKAGTTERVLGFPYVKESSSTIWGENDTSISTGQAFTYDNIGNLLEQLDKGDTSKTGDEKSSATTYAQAYETGFNRPLETALKNKDGNIVTKKNFEYDTKGNLTKEIVDIFNPLTTSRQLPATSYSYDSFGNLTATINALGSAITTEYETTFYAYPERVTNSLGHTIQYVYEPKFGAVKSVTDTNGVTSTTTYDSLGRVTQVKNGFDQVVNSYTYPDFNTKTTTNAIGLSATEYIDGLGRKYKTVSTGEDGNSPRQVVAETYYNNRGLTSAESLPHYIDEDPAQISYARYVYDIRGRVNKTISDFPGTLADAQATVNYINPLYTETTDPRGNRKGALKDVNGNVVEVTEFTSGGVYKTQYEYDIQNNLIKTTDALGNIAQIFYDSAGRKLKMIDPDMGTWTYEYDLLGNLIKQTDAKGQVLGFSYDVLNRLIQKAQLNPLSLVLSTYQYDDSSKQYCTGRLSKVTDQSGSTEFFYDKLGREIKSIKSIEGIAYSVEREYDVLDRLTKLTYPDGEAITYAYDANSGSLESVRSTLSAIRYVEDITYNAKGQIKNIQYGNGTRTQYTYGQDLRLSQILTQNAQNNVLQSLNYVFDKNGNITTLIDNIRSNIRTYTYDDLDRLTRADNSPSPQGGYTTFSYQYNAIGNMTYKSDVGVMSYGQGVGPHALTSAGGYTYQYDANGNMTAGKNKTLSYDAENRLTQANVLGVLTSFIYDGDGGRVKKTTGSNSTTYIGSLFEKDSDGKIRKHIFAGSNRVATNESTGNTYYYHSDHLGSSNVMTDQNSQQAQYCEYTPYGTLARNQGTDVARHKFTGKELDNTGLYFYGARYYDPEIGRFITADTVVARPYDPQDLNRYSYCRNNPINYVDPSGHIWWWIIPAIIGAIIGGLSAGIQSGWDFKAVLIGACIGAVSGVVGFGAAGATAQILGKVGSAAFGGMIGGATAGFLNSAYYGGDLLRGTLMGAGIGALSGLAFGTISNLGGKGGWKLDLARVVFSGAAGGGIAELGGGKFWEGFAFAAAIAGADFLYRAALRSQGYEHGASADTAIGDGEAKIDKAGNVQKVIHDPKLRINNVGFASQEGDGGFWSETGKRMSWVGKNIPVVNETSYFHDIITDGFTKIFGPAANGIFFNIPSMVPSFAITAAGAVINSQPALIGQFALYNRDAY